MPIISVIIPVYNVEKYLRKCIDSVLNQEIQEIEVILVNDGSTDNSGKICNEYAKKDSRIKVIHKKNGGSAEARNIGIDNANSEYILFLDSDDYWEGNDCLKNIVTKIKENEFDVLLYGCMDYSSITGKKQISRTGYDKEKICSENRTKVLEYLFNSGMFPGSAWITVSKRSFILENGLYFTKGIKAEDIDWLLDVFTKARKFEAIDDYFYIYRKYNSNSITGKSDLKSLESLLYIIEKWSMKMNDEQYNDIKHFVNSYLAYHFLCSIMIFNKLNIEQKKYIKPRILKNDYILKYARLKMVRYASVIYRVLGLNITSKIFYIYYNVKSREK